MLIGGIQKFSLLDYPKKVAAIVFTQGCGFRCKYCHNAELVLPEKYQKPIPEKDIFDFLQKRVGKLDGIVISGGEPTLQKDLFDFITKIKNMGFLVKLDSAGIFPEKIEYLIKNKLIDYIAMDFKAPLSKYQNIVTTDIDTNNIKKSSEIIINSKINHEFRTTIASALLTPKDIIKIAQTIKGAQTLALQKFIPHKDVNLPEGTFSEKSFKFLKTEVEKYVENCILR